MARKRPHGGAGHHPRKTRGGETRGDRGVPPALPQPALRRPADAAAGAGLQSPPLPLGDHRAHARPHRRGDTRRRAGLLPHPLPSFERHPVHLGRLRRGAHARPCRKVVRPARRPHRGLPAHPPGTGSGGAAPGGGRTRRARHDPVDGLPHGQPHLAGFLYRRPGIRPPVGRRLVAALQTPGAGTAPAGLGQRLHFGRHRPGIVRLYGATAAGHRSRTGRSGFPCRNRSIAKHPGIGLRGREGQKQVRGQHALRRAERDEQGDEPGLLRDAGRPAVSQRRGRGLPCRHDRRHPRLQPPHLPPRKLFHPYLQSEK